MECRKWPKPGRSNPMLATSKSSHVISKPRAASCGHDLAPPTANIIPTIRIVHIFAPKIIKTDPANFRAVVQKLTGRHSGRQSKKSKHTKKEKPNSPNSPSEPRFCESTTDSDKSEVHVHPAAMLTTDDEDHTCSKGQTEFNVCYRNQYVDVPAQVKEERPDPDSFSSFFGGFGELDIFAAFMDSGAVPSEFFNSPALLQTDHHGSIFKASESNGCFGDFYQQERFLQ